MGGANNQKFGREGDLNSDPADCFFIKANNCSGNIYQINQNKFTIQYGHHTSNRASQHKVMSIAGTFPIGTDIKEVDGNLIDQLDELITSRKSNKPVIIAKYPVSTIPFYIELHNPKSHSEFQYNDLSNVFNKGVEFRTQIASRIKIKTPDPFLNTLGGTFSGAEDAVWQSPSYLHGAICFRELLLTGWRGAYLADLMGLEDRAKTHFNGYLNSQVIDVPVTLPHLQDTALNLARSAKIWGTPMYSNGYIGRVPNRRDVMHHYDMNLVFIDQLLWHLKWTGDLDYAREIYPALQRHFTWEKKLFDPDNDGLYDAYACIWASDALQYNGGKVTHSTAYNYRANKIMAEISEKLGKDPSIYKKEAELILSAINKELWIKDKGWWAEFKDNMGNRIRHDNAAIWTIYHAIDSDIHDPFKAYQATRYIDTEIPHIPVMGKGLKDTANYVISTTNWQPYMWSINNVAFGEISHTALAYWQTGRYEEAFKMFKGAVLDAMYLGSGPGNVTQLSFYDAARRETYRDFADGIATGVRALVQGMYGIMPDLINNRLTIRPGFPDDWNFAEVETQNMAYTFERKGNIERYSITPNLLKKDVSLSMEIKAIRNKIKSIKVNGKDTPYTLLTTTILSPEIKFEAGIADKYDITIEWDGEKINRDMISVNVANGSQFRLNIPYKSGKIYDPQNVLRHANLKNDILTGTITAQNGHRTVFVNITNGNMNYWLPIDINVNNPLDIVCDSESSSLIFTLKNNMDKVIKGDLYINGKKVNENINIEAHGKNNYEFDIPIASSGTNRIKVKSGKDTYSFRAINWNISVPEKSVYKTVDMKKIFNDKVSNIFAYGKYMFPRWKYTTLQVPTQGMGQWCHPQSISVIDDRGIRNKASRNNNRFIMPQGIPFSTPGEKEYNNIAFTTLWDNYPTSINIPLNGKASKAYFLIAASTYYMQSHIVNGEIKIEYTDGQKEVLKLILPDNLIPLDQDIFVDGYAFNTKDPRPWRVRLKTGDVSKYHAGELGKTISNNPISIDGGMATMLDLPLNPVKELKSLSLETTANEVVIGLMGVTLVK